MRQAVFDYLESYRTRDIEARLARFAPDATFEDPVGVEAIVGRDALREFWLAGAAFIVEMDLELLAVTGDEAAYVFTAVVRQDRTDVVRIRTIETLELDDAGLISRMRSYFDASLIS